jgi:hypothetical protein
MSCQMMGYLWYKYCNKEKIVSRAFQIGTEAGTGTRYSSKYPTGTKVPMNESVDRRKLISRLQEGAAIDVPRRMVRIRPHTSSNTANGVETLQIMCASPHIYIIYSSELYIYVNYRYSTYEKPLAMASTPRQPANHMILQVSHRKLVSRPVHVYSHTAGWLQCRLAITVSTTIL